MLQDETDKLIVFSTLAILFLIIMMIVLYVIFLRKRTGLLMERQEKEIEFKKELAVSQVEIKEQTLNYVGQELHDDLGQKLSVVRLRMNQLKNQLEGQNKSEIDEINEIIRDCIQDVRNLSKNLVSDQVEYFGLIDSIKREIEKIKKINQLHVDYDSNIDDVDIKGRKALILFRIIQETLNNILKHSKAKNIDFHIEQVKHTLTIKISDDGVGFDPTVLASGSGLKNIKSRAALINTEVSIQSKINKGTQTVLQTNIN